MAAADYHDAMRPGAPLRGELRSGAKGLKQPATDRPSIEWVVRPNFGNKQWLFERCVWHNPDSNCTVNLMNVSPYFMPRPSAEGRGLFSGITAGERPGRRPPVYLVTLMALRIQKLRLTMLTTAILCSTISRLVAAEPSVEVFTQGSTITNARGGDISLLPQIPFRWSIATSVGYDDNVNTTAGGAGSAFTQANLAVTKDLRTDRTQLSIVLRTGVVYYFDRVDGRGNDVTGSLNVSLQHHVSERLTLAASVDAAYLAEPDFATDLGPAHRQNYFSTTDSLTASYLWSPRLSTDSSYQLRGVDYEDELASVGQDRLEHTFSESFHFRCSPRATLTAEYRFELIDYRSFPLDSSTHTALGGFDYAINSRLNATMRGGASFRNYKNEVYGEQTTPYAAASLNYALGPSTGVNWTASYSIEEPNSAQPLSRTTFRTGLQLSYDFTKRITTHFGLNYHHDVNTSLLPSGFPGVDQMGYTENGVELVLGANYAVTARLAIDLGFTHTELDSERSIGGYSRNRYTAGLTLKY